MRICFSSQHFPYLYTCYVWIGECERVFFFVSSFSSLFFWYSLAFPLKMVRMVFTQKIIGANKLPDIKTWMICSRIILL